MKVMVAKPKPPKGAQRKSTLVTLVPKPLRTGNPLISNPFTDVFAIH